MIQSGIDLLNAQAQGCRYPEQGCHGSQNVDEVSGPAVYAIPEQGVKGSPDGKGEPLVESEKGQGKADQGIDGPGMEPPVQKGDVHGHPGGLGGPGLDVRVGRIMEHGFGNAVKKQAYTHARGK